MYYDPANPIKRDIELADRRITMVADGNSVCTGLFGPPGIGKTYLCETVFRRKNMVEGRDWMLTRGSGVGLLHNVYAMRHGGVLLMDDCDELVIGGGQTHTNRMKELLAPQKIRRINNYTKAAMQGKDDIPESFLTQCGVVWLTNIDMSKIDKATAKRLEPLESRGMIPSVIDGDPRNCANYVVSLVVDDGVQLVAGETKQRHKIHLTREETNDVLRYFAVNAWRLKTICVRRLNSLAMYRRFNPDCWRELADKDLRPEPICNYPLPPVPYIAAKSEAAPSPKTLASGQPDPPEQVTKKELSSEPLATETRAAEPQSEAHADLTRAKARPNPPPESEAPAPPPDSRNDVDALIAQINALMLDDEDQAFFTLEDIAERLSMTGKRTLVRRALIQGVKEDRIDGYSDGTYSGKSEPEEEDFVPVSRAASAPNDAMRAADAAEADKPTVGVVSALVTQAPATKADAVKARIGAVVRILTDGPATDNSAYTNWASKDCHRLNAADIARAIGMDGDTADRMQVHYAIRRALEDGLIEKHGDKTYSVKSAAYDLAY